MNPTRFAPASKAPTFRKVAIFGGPGSGKTIVCLSAPGRKLVIDTEGGTLNYSSLTEFGVEHTQSFRTVKDTIDDLAKNPPKEETTLVIDSASIIWSGLQQSMLEKKMEEKGIVALEGTEKVQFSMADWGILKRWNADIFNTLMALKCHVVCTFRESETRDDDFKPTGNFIPEWEKKTPYTFDFVFRIVKRTAECRKGRAAKDGILLDLEGKKIALPKVEKGSDLPSIWKALFGEFETGVPSQAHPSEEGEKDRAAVTKDPTAVMLARQLRAEVLPKFGISNEDAEIYLCSKTDGAGKPLAARGEDGKVHLSDCKANVLKWLIDNLAIDKNRLVIISKIEALKKEKKS